ncbi:MAG: 23S rRNA (pseudouridine(1915)-N(3))-methyltransferase RlmH [Pseudomonadota bacterium]|nr:23S rRNA (pseudouridine(1915)-N(3))-methyltransferase RlmH [Pseudomonadota bacterium]
MQLRLIAVGPRQPEWVNTAFCEYSRRFPGECRLELTELALGPRGKGRDPQHALAVESERMIKVIPSHAWVVALDERGTAWTSRELARRLEGWMNSGQDVALLMGGPDGLSAACKAHAREQWSLSALTLPHGLARVVVAEALYRAHSLLKGHPYHRD